MLLSAAVLALVLAVTGIGAYLYLDQRVGTMARLPDPFASLAPNERPTSTPSGTTFLLLGVDAEDAVADPWLAARADAILVVHIDRGGGQVSVVSIPRDSWVDIPGHGMAKINAAYAFGGSTLTVETVERLADLRIDHVAIVDWSGFRALTDAVDGVEVAFSEAWRDPYHGMLFTPGVHRLNGEQAMWYVRERHSLVRGDLDRVHRHQHFLRSLFNKVVAQDTLSDPGRALGLFNAITSEVTVDSHFDFDDMWRLAHDVRGLHDQARFMTAPVNGTGWVGDQSVVWLDGTRSAAFWSAIGTGDVDAYLATHGTEVLGPPPQ